MLTTKILASVALVAATATGALAAPCNDRAPTVTYAQPTYVDPIYQAPARPIVLGHGPVVRPGHPIVLGHGPVLQVDARDRAFRHRVDVRFADGRELAIRNFK